MMMMLATSPHQLSQDHSSGGNSTGTSASTSSNSSSNNSTTKSTSTSTMTMTASTPTTKRKRDGNSETFPLPVTKIQTRGLETPRTRRVSDVGNDGTSSPRTAMSARFQGLNLHSRLSPTGRMPRRESWTIVHEDPDGDGDLESELGPDSVVGFEKRSFSQQLFDHSVEIKESPEPRVSTSEAERSQKIYDQDVFEFKAGSTPTTCSFFDSNNGQSSTVKSTRFETTDEPCTPSPTKRRCNSSVSPTPTLVSTPIPRSQSPSARKLPSHHKRKSESSDDSELAEPEETQLWWQESEITGHDPTDPEDDARGVNGIGYQKSRVDAWTIAEKKKKQIAEWRSREAREARALRAGGRRTLMGRVTKSRSGSPVERRSSPSLSKEKESLPQSPKKGVRFRVG